MRWETEDALSEEVKKLVRQDTMQTVDMSLTFSRGGTKSTIRPQAITCSDFIKGLARQFVLWMFGWTFESPRIEKTREDTILWMKSFKQVFKLLEQIVKLVRSKIFFYCAGDTGDDVSSTVSTGVCFNSRTRDTVEEIEIIYGDPKILLSFKKAEKQLPFQEILMQLQAF